MAKQQASDTAYNAGSIEVLEQLEAVRKRPGMYLGGKDASGCLRAGIEIVDNCVDEHIMGFGDLVIVHYDLKTKYVTVADRGRGVPVAIHEKTRESTLTTVFTRLHAGGKFGGGSYAKTGGLHGVGASCTNAVSDSFEAWSFQTNGTIGAKKAWYYQKFSKGKPLTKVIQKDPPKPWCDAKQGTIVRFHLDAEIFGDHIIDPKSFLQKMKDMSQLNPGLRFKCIFGERTFEFVNEHGLMSMVYNPAQKEQMLGKPFRIYERGQIDLALCWYDDDDGWLKSHVNSSATGSGGCHVDGFKQALTNAMREVTGTTFETKYWMMGLRAAINWRMEEPVYRGQTKDELASEVDTEVRNFVQPKLALFLTQNPQLVKRLKDRAERFKKNEERFKADNKAIKSLEIAGKDDQAIDPSKLIQADPGVPPHLRELVLVEGDSAGGTAERAKAPHHEILKLRGVGINAQRHESARVLANREIKLLIRAIGIKPGEIDLKKMRVGSITILTDADPDGKHIASLLLAFFKVYYPEIVRQKKLRYINGPLFLGQYREQRVFADTKDEVYEGFTESQHNQVRITRFKGWGEASEDQLEHIAFNPKTRRLVVLTMQDEDELKIARIMGHDVEHRKELLFGTSNNQEN
jgi:DNA gyrase/topoisomerase IV subunit B